MVKDRNGVTLNVGDKVKIIPGMAIRDKGEKYDIGRIVKIDGEYIDVKIILDTQTVVCERYGSELWSRAYD